jgi:hypothetical protein
MAVESMAELMAVEVMAVEIEPHRTGVTNDHSICLCLLYAADQRSMALYLG